MQIPTPILPLILTTALLLLAASVRPMQDDDLTKLTRALEMLGPVTPEWIMATHPGILTVLDAEKRLYQIKVLGQAPDECTLHAVRNSFYLLKLFTGTRAEFSTVYNQMVNEDSYEKFAEGFARQKRTACNIEKMTPDVVIKKVKIGALPNDSQKLIQKMTEPTYYYGNTDIGSPSLSQNRSFAIMANLLPTLEPNLKDPLAIPEAMISETPATETLAKLQKQGGDYCFCIDLRVATIYQHATALLVNSVNGVASSIFANSLANNSPSTLAAIEAFSNFANNPERIEDAIIRHHYFSKLDKDNTMSARSLKPSLKNLPKDISIEKLKQNTLFKNFYYPALKSQYEKLKGTAKNEKEQDWLNESKKLLEDLDPSKG